MFKINLDKLTDFERQMVVMFEMHLPKVGVNDHVFQIPDLPAIQLGRWPFAKMIKPAEKNQAATWYRRLSWRGQIVAHQLHRRALTRAVESQPAVAIKEDAALKAAMSSGLMQGQIMGAAAAKRQSYLGALNSPSPGAGLGNLYSNNPFP